MPNDFPLAVQLYTVRDQVAADFGGAVLQLAEMGYRGVELAGFGNLKSAAEVRAALDAANLSLVGSHVGIERLETDLDAVLAEQRTLGNRTIIIPWMPEDRRLDAEGWKRTAGALTELAQRCRERDVELCYHHHSFEFQRFDGTTGMDLLLESSDPQLLKIELDVYWLQHGGEDPVRFIQRLGRRVSLVHLKDMAAGEERRFAPVGTGILDFRAILRTCRSVGVRWGVVEQDRCYDTPPMEAVRISFQHLEKLRNE